MANLGNVAIKPKGEWVIGVTYKPLNAVTHNGNLYLALQENAVEPSDDGVNWWLILEGVPIATAEILGKSKPDGETITIDEDGTLHGASQVPEGVTYIDDSQEETLPDRLLINADLLDGNSSDYYANIETVTNIQGDIDTLEENITQLSNSNLLINPNFIISDYKTLSLIGAGKQDYICDNWFYYWVNNEGSCEYNNGVITLYYGRIGQKIELPAGRYTVTANILESDSTIAVYVNGYGYADHQIGHFQSGITGLVSFTFEVHEFNEIFFQLIDKSENGVKFNWIKLETGNIATRYIIPNQEIELLKCNGYTKASNPNLLINPDFKICQRNMTEYNTNKAENGGRYYPDRWICRRDYNDTGLKYTIQEDGLHAKFMTTAESWGSILYKMDLETAKFLSGKTITISGKIRTSNSNIKGMNLYQGSTYIVNGAPKKIGEDFYTVTAKMPEITDNLVLEIRFDGVQNGETIFEYLKLELGSVATPFVSPDRATELLKCMRYYQKIGIDENPNLILNIPFRPISYYIYGVNDTRNFLDFVLYFNIKLRTIPTVKLFGISNNDTGYSIAYVKGHSPDKTRIWKYNTTHANEYLVQIKVTAEDGNITDDDFDKRNLVFYNNSGIEVDAEVH